VVAWSLGWSLDGRWMVPCKANVDCGSALTAFFVKVASLSPECKSAWLRSPTGLPLVSIKLRPATLEMPRLRIHTTNV
jgi:hypothetical protein